MFDKGFKIVPIAGGVYMRGCDWQWAIEGLGVHKGLEMIGYLDWTRFESVDSR